MALPNYTPIHYRIWHYTYLVICGLVFFFLIAPLFVILPLSFNAEQYIHFSEKMLAFDPEGLKCDFIAATLGLLDKLLIEATFSDEDIKFISSSI